jgi:hypothetical protein
MRTPWRLLVVPVVALGVAAACGGDNSSGGARTTAAGTTATTAAPTATTATAATTAGSGSSNSSAATTAPAGAATTAASSTNPTEVQVPGADDEIIVQVGIDDAATTGSRVEKVAVGADVVLRLIDESSDEEYHIHGYDLEQKVAKGVEAQFEFTADQKGSFEVESHTTDKVLVVLQVG